MKKEIARSSVNRQCSNLFSQKLQAVLLSRAFSFSAIFLADIQFISATALALLPLRFQSAPLKPTKNPDSSDDRGSGNVANKELQRNIAAVDCAAFSMHHLLHLICRLIRFLFRKTIENVAVHNEPKGLGDSRIKHVQLLGSLRSVFIFLLLLVLFPHFVVLHMSFTTFLPLRSIPTHIRQ